VAALGQIKIKIVLSNGPRFRRPRIMPSDSGGDAKKWARPGRGHLARETGTETAVGREFRPNDLHRWALGAGNHHRLAPRPGHPAPNL